MAQDIQLDFATAGPNVVMPTADVTDGNASPVFGGAAAVGLDLGAITPFEVAFEWIQTTLASCVDFCHLGAMWSHDNSDFGDSDNYEIVATIQCTASTDKKACGTFEVKGRYLKFIIINESGGSLDFTSSNSDITLWDVAGDQA